MRNDAEVLAAADAWRKTVLHSVEGKPTLGNVIDAATATEGARWLAWAESKGPGLDAYREQGARIAELTEFAVTVAQYMEMTGCPECCAGQPDEGECVYWAAKRLSGEPRDES